MLAIAWAGVAGAAGDARSEAAAKRNDSLHALLGKLDAEPLLALYTPDIRGLPEKFVQTHLYKALQDPSYARGAATLKTVLNQGIGADVETLWPDFSKLLSGPAVLAMLPGGRDEEVEPGKGGPAAGGDARATGDASRPAGTPALPTPAPADEPAFRLELLALVPGEEAARALHAMWPRLPPQSTSLLAALRLRTVLPAELAQANPRAGDSWPEAELGLRMLPRKLAARVGKWLDEESGDTPSALDILAPVLSDAAHPGIEEFSLGLRFKGEYFNDELRLLPSREKERAFASVAAAIRENPAPFDSLMAATPGEQDLVVLGQLELAALSTDLPYAAQAMERYLRGKRWVKSKAAQAGALDPRRFMFLLERLQGSFAIAGRPALSGDLRLAVVAALKPDPNAPAPAGPGSKEAENEAFRATLLQNLSRIDAEFETLREARKIGGSPPLGARFQGRGLFGAPLIGLSNGWVWLCSNLAAYQDLTGSFKSGKTLAAEARAANGGAPKGAVEWREGDALRVQVDLEKIVKLAYAAWLLSGGEGPYLGAWKVPMDLLPQPQVFANRIGVLRTGVRRGGEALHIYSSSALPGSSLIAAALLQGAAAEIESARALTRRAAALAAESNHPLPPAPAQRSDKRPEPPTLEGGPPRIEIVDPP